MDTVEATAKVAVLHPPHLDDLRVSGLSDAMIIAMNVRSVTDPALLRKLLMRQDLPDRVTGMAIPYLHTEAGDQCVRVKLFPALAGKDGHTIRYLQARDSALHLYFPPGVAALLSDPTEALFITEGEKKAAKATQEGLPCIGLGGVWNFLIKGTSIAIEELTAIAWMKRPVTIVPDSDVWARPDLLHAVYALGRELERQGAVVAVVIIPPCDGRKMGFDDFLVALGVELFGDLERVGIGDRKAWQAQRQWYEGWLKRKAEAVAEAQSSPLSTLGDPEPASELVEAAALLDALGALFAKYVVLPEGAADALALWSLHTWTLDAADVSPILGLTSPQKRCGKTQTLEVLRNTSRRAVLAGNISPAAVFRFIEAVKPCLLIDEADTFLPDNDELRGVLNAGHTKGSYIIRTVGDAHEPKMFATFGAKAIAAIGSLPSTIEDRSIRIPMRRKAPGEKVARLRRDGIAAECDPLRSQALRWTNDHLEELRDADPETPSQLNDRAADNWRPLFAIADLAGRGWASRARKAAVVLSGTAAVEDDDVAIHLLTDMRTLFEEHGERLESESVVAELAKIETRPWREWKGGHPITPIQLARLLKAFDIKPQQIWINDKKSRGYKLEDFEDAFNRYLSAEPGIDPVDPVEPLGDKAEQPFDDPVGSDAPTDSESAIKPVCDNDSTVPTGSNAGRRSPRTFSRVIDGKQYVIEERESGVTASPLAVWKERRRKAA